MFTRGYRANRHTFWQSAADHFRWSNETIGGAPGKSLSWGLHILSGKHHKFSWVNQLFLWPFSIAMLNYQRVTPMSLGFMVDIPILIEVFLTNKHHWGATTLYQKIGDQPWLRFNGAWYSLSGTDFRRKCFWNAWLCVFCENGKDEDPSSI